MLVKVRPALNIPAAAYNAIADFSPISLVNPLAVLSQYLIGLMRKINIQKVEILKTKAHKNNKRRVSFLSFLKRKNSLQHDEELLDNGKREGMQHQASLKE